MERIDWVYILAGGQSSRFGQNKACVSVFGEPLIVRLANQLASEDLTLRLVAQRTADYEEFGIPTIEDIESNCGPLAGVLAALTDCEQRGRSWCFISCCDMLDWRPEWCPKLVATIAQDPSLDAVVLSGAQDSPDAFRPFPGLYRSKLSFKIQELWNQGVRSMREFHSRIDSTIGRALISHDLMPKCFNTPAEFAYLLDKKA